MPSIDATALASGRLVSQLATGTTTGVTLQSNRVNGSYITWPTGAFRLTLIRKTETDLYLEIVGVASASMNATTGVVTLGTLTRNLSQTDGTDTTGTSATVTWPSGTLCFISWGVHEAENTLMKDVANTLTGSGAIRSSSTTTPVIRLNSVTTAQRTAMTPANGDMVYDTDLSQFYKYEAGAWAAVATGTFSNAANGTAGKTDLATAAEVAAGTANDASSGAPNVIPVSICKKTSTGAVEGTIPALNSNVAVDPSVGGTGRTSHTAYAVLCGGTTSTGAQQSVASVGTAGQVLTSNGAGALPTFQTLNNCRTLYQTTADSGGVTAGSFTDFDQSYTITGGTLAVGDAIEVRIYLGTNNSAVTGQARARIGGQVVTTLASMDMNATPEISWYGIVQSVGVSGTMLVRFHNRILNAVDTPEGGAKVVLTLDTTGDLVVDAQGLKSSGAGTLYIHSFTIRLYR